MADSPNIQYSFQTLSSTTSQIIACITVYVEHIPAELMPASIVVHLVSCVVHRSRSDAIFAGPDLHDLERKRALPTRGIHLVFERAWRNARVWVTEGNPAQYGQMRRDYGWRSSTYEQQLPSHGSHIIGYSCPCKLSQRSCTSYVL